jgi:hypothetical protein
MDRVDQLDPVLAHHRGVAAAGVIVPDRDDRALHLRAQLRQQIGRAQDGQAVDGRAGE